MQDNEKIGLVPCKRCNKEITLTFFNDKPYDIYMVRCTECGHLFEMLGTDIIEINDAPELYVTNVNNEPSSNTRIYIELGKDDNPVYYIEKILSMFPTQQLILKNHDGSTIGQDDFYSVDVILNKLYQSNQKPSYEQCIRCKEKKLNE